MLCLLRASSRRRMLTRTAWGCQVEVSTPWAASRWGGGFGGNSHSGGIPNFGGSPHLGGMPHSGQLHIHGGHLPALQDRPAKGPRFGGLSPNGHAPTSGTSKFSGKGPRFGGLSPNGHGLNGPHLNPNRLGGSASGTSTSTVKGPQTGGLNPNGHGPASGSNKGPQTGPYPNTVPLLAATKVHKPAALIQMATATPTARPRLTIRTPHPSLAAIPLTPQVGSSLPQMVPLTTARLYRTNQVSQAPSRVEARPIPQAALL